MHDESLVTHKLIDITPCRFGLCDGSGYLMVPDGDGANAHLEWCGCRPMPEANIGYCDENWNPISKEEWEAAQRSPWSL